MKLKRNYLFFILLIVPRLLWGMENPNKRVKFNDEDIAINLLCGLSRSIIQTQKTTTIDISTLGPSDQCIYVPFKTVDVTVLPGKVSMACPLCDKKFTSTVGIKPIEHNVNRSMRAHLLSQRHLGLIKELNPGVVSLLDDGMKKGYCHWCPRPGNIRSSKDSYTAHVASHMQLVYQRDI